SSDVCSSDLTRRLPAGTSTGSGRKTTRARRPPPGHHDAATRRAPQAKHVMGRTTMRHRKSMLSTAIAVCLGIAMPVHAQEAAGEAAADEATELDRVVVTGIRASLQQALDTKRNSDAIIDVVTAEDVGKFPSTNVAEAISTLPGVTIDKAFGQGEKISILGTDPALSRTLLNGQTVASADWFITDQPGRTFNYSLLAPQLVGRVEVYKSPEAHIDEGSIGGTVIVQTRKPLDLERTTIAG